VVKCKDHLCILHASPAGAIQIDASSYVHLRHDVPRCLDRDSARYREDPLRLPVERPQECAWWPLSCGVGQSLYAEGVWGSRYPKPSKVEPCALSMIALVESSGGLSVVERVRYASSPKGVGDL
jgi:hypothetical protein